MQDWKHNIEFCKNQNSNLISIDSSKQAEFIVWKLNWLNKDSTIRPKTLTPLIFIGTVFQICYCEYLVSSMLVKDAGDEMF